MDWTGLKKVHDWKYVQECCCSISTVGTNWIVVKKELLHRFSCMKEYFEEKLKERNENSTTCFVTVRKSVEVKTCLFVQFSFAGPGLNTAIEHTIPFK